MICANNTCKTERKSNEGSEFINPMTKEILWVCPRHVAERNEKISQDRAYC